MNYIKQLEQDRTNLANKLASIMVELNDFQTFLHSAKFTGTEGGERKDWISTGDVIIRIKEIKRLI